MATHNRPARVAEEFRQELSARIARGLKDPRITGFVTVTGAKMAPDLKEITVYLSIHGDEKVRTQTLEGLRAAATYLQAEVARALKLRHTPHLRLVYDESIERGDRIERLLKEAKAMDAASAAAGAEAPPAKAGEGEPESGP
ncbi:MAG: 30S ribosome-binding factor RbfA [Anaeromyxobacter sp.]